MATEKHSNPYGPTKEDFKRFAEICGLEFAEQSFEEFAADPPYDPEAQEIYERMLPDVSQPDIKELLFELAGAAFTDPGDPFYDYLCENKERIYDAARVEPKVVEVVVMGLKMGIEQGSSACMNYLGALYYMGDLVEQDYQKAAELYEMATNAGNYQSTINLGYIYEYGRIGTPDYQKAFMYYSLAVAMYPSCEALYKLGDQFSRGQAVEEDKQKAYRLYERSLNQAQNIVEKAQPAIRMAAMLIDEGNGLYDIPFDPLYALHLYQEAEIGLRIDIKDGQYYYEKRLQEALEGQKRARALVEGGSVSKHGEL